MDKMIKGTETEKSLLKAFAGESQAKNRYTFFSEIAKKEGYEQIAGIFYETALQEEMHAKRFFSYLEGGMLEITAAYPAGALLDTLANLAEAADGEHDEAFNLYPAFGKIAEEEGFKKVAFSRPEEVRWYCRKCGYVHVGKTPPEICPSCLHPKGYFELFPDNY